MITENIISRRPYHKTSNADGAVWAKSQIRKYLNGTFLNEFSSAEQSLILETVNKNPLAREYGRPSVSPDTTDRIFLLSKEEFQSYTESGALPIPDNDNDDLFGLTYLSFWLRAPMRPSFPCEATYAIWEKEFVKRTQSFTVKPVTQRCAPHSLCGLRPVMWVKTK